MREKTFEEYSREHRSDLEGKSREELMAKCPITPSLKCFKLQKLIKKRMWNFDEKRN